MQKSLLNRSALLLLWLSVLCFSGGVQAFSDTDDGHGAMISTRMLAENGIEADKLVARVAQNRTESSPQGLAARHESETAKIQLDELIRSNEQLLLHQRWLWSILGGSLITLIIAAYFLLRLHRANRQCRAANSQMKMMTFALNHVREAVYLSDVDGRLLYVNEEACRALGYSREELLGMTVLDIDANASIEELALIRSKVRMEEERVFERRHKTRNGETFPVEILSTGFEYDGEILGVSLVRNITERARMLEELATRERDFRSLAENLPDNIARWDCDGRYLYINPTHELTLRTPAADVLGKRTSEIFPDGRFALAERVIAMVAETGQAQFISVPVPQEDGSTSIHEVNYVPERNAQGEVVSVLGIGRDMTAQIRLQEAVIQSEAALRSLTDSAPFSIIRYDTEGRITYVNAPLLGYFGIPLSELIGKLPREIWPDGDFAEIDLGLAQVLETKALVVVEFSEPGAEGKMLHHQIWIAPEKDASGELVGIIAFGLDISERRRAEREVLLLNRALDNSFDAVYLFGADLCFRYVNEAAVRALGYSREELLSLSVFDIDPNVTHEMMHGLLHGLMQQTTAAWNPPGVIESTHRRKNGETFPIEVGASTFSYEDETMFLTAARDITERKRAEHDLEESRMQLRGLIVQRELAREEERKLIARDVHDELGQILTGLKLNLSVIKRKMDSPVLREQMQESMALMDAAISSVRNISAALRSVELEMGIVAAIKLQAGRFSAYTGTLCELHIEELEMQLNEPCTVALFRIVQESLTNIARHAQAGMVNITFTQEAENCILKISDNGTGFDPGVKKNGSFGLVGMRERVLMLNGELTINSKPGKGTQIVVRFPLPAQ